MPQKSIVSKSRDKNPLATKLFGENALKDNLSDQISPNPLVVFCRNHKNQEFTGDKLSGFSTKFCNDFYLAPSHRGICITKNLDLKNQMYLGKTYNKFFEAEKQSAKVKVEKYHHWAVSTYVINAKVLYQVLQSSSPSLLCHEALSNSEAKEP